MGCLPALDGTETAGNTARAGTEGGGVPGGSGIEEMERGEDGGEEEGEEEGEE